MKTVRRMLHRDLTASIFFVALAFLSLFFFIDFVSDLQDVGQRGYTAWMAALDSVMELPGHLYELLPIAVLIGAIYALARMAQTSEFTILRTSGLGPWRALRLLAVLALGFSVLTFALGDYVVPASERQAVLLKARGGDLGRVGRNGAWLKEHRGSGADERSFSVNVAGIDSRGILRGIRIFEFGPNGEHLQRISAADARVGADGVWTLHDVQIIGWPDMRGGKDNAVQLQQLASLRWPSTLSASVVSAAVLPLQTMSTTDLWRYSEHLSDQEQAAQRYRIQFWKKALYPLACLVLTALALPFAYLHARSGGISLKVFGGIMLGVSFALLSNVSGHIGLLLDWTPWVAAAAPSVLFMLLSMAAFVWLVRYR